MSEENGDEIVSAIVNLLKRIQKMESRLNALEAFLSGKFKMPKNDEASKWSDWARKVIFKVIEWLFVILAAILGIKLIGST